MLDYKNANALRPAAVIVALLPSTRFSTGTAVVLPTLFRLEQYRP
jgi:hypothetical protein